MREYVLMNIDEVNQLSLALHKLNRGKIETRSKITIENGEDLALAYTPGVAEPCREIARDPQLANVYTNRKNTVAVISNGSAVLGLGNIGPLAALPVMEGKSILFKRFANIDSVPLVINETDPQKLAYIIRTLAPSFGGINLEDIKAPECFIVESLLQDVGIPVVHDDQHGTAMVVLAALVNALKVVGKESQPIHIVVVGAGAAGTAITKLLIAAGNHSVIDLERIIVCDSIGALSTSRSDLNSDKQELALLTDCSRGIDVHTAMIGADVVIGVSRSGGFKNADISVMNPNAIVFALANPVPEVLPPDALAAGAAVVATGRSDFPNQVNNVLVFPGLFRGLLDHDILSLTDEMQLAVSQAVAALVDVPNISMILPDIFDTRIVPAISEAINLVR